jgi:hypothetical protein
MDTTQRARFGRRELRRMKEAGTPYEIQERGPLNPIWREWLMGFPLGWTDSAD